MPLAVLIATKRLCSKLYRFPVDTEQCSKWIATVKKQNWLLNEHSWVYFISGKKNDSLSPDFVPSFFSDVKSKAAVGEVRAKKYTKTRRIDLSGAK